MRYLVLAALLLAPVASQARQHDGLSGFDFTHQRIYPLVDPRPDWQQFQSPLYDAPSYDSGRSYERSSRHSEGRGQDFDDDQD